jgi:hypothetical protein
VAPNKKNIVAIPIQINEMLKINIILAMPFKDPFGLISIKYLSAFIFLTITTLQ